MLILLPMRSLVTLMAAAMALASAPARAAGIEAAYAVTQSGLTVMEVRIEVDLRHDSYRFTSVAQSRGIGRLFLPTEQRAEVVGGLSGIEVIPRRYSAAGEYRGRQRRTVMDYLRGTPRLTLLEPPEDPDRIPVPPDQVAGTIDALSALVRLARGAAQTGRCDFSSAVFDGRRRLEWSSRTLGVGPAPVSGISGDVLRCELESRLVAGFRREDDPEKAGAPRKAEAWLAVLRPGTPPLPVRVEFPGTFWGSLRLDLTRIETQGR